MFKHLEPFKTFTVSRFQHCLNRNSVSTLYSKYRYIIHNFSNTQNTHYLCLKNRMLGLLLRTNHFPFHNYCHGIKKVHFQGTIFFFRRNINFNNFFKRTHGMQQELICTRQQFFKFIFIGLFQQTKVTENKCVYRLCNGFNNLNTKIVLKSAKQN